MIEWDRVAELRDEVGAEDFAEVVELFLDEVEATLARIVRVHYPQIKERLLATALTQFFELRETAGLKKRPSTSEMLDWLKLILAEDLAPEDLARDGVNALPKLHGALLKNEQDVALFERLAFMARGERR